MKLQYLVLATDDKGATQFYTGRGFSANPNKAWKSESLDSVDLYVTWGQQDHPTWTDWKIRVSERAL